MEYHRTMQKNELLIHIIKWTLKALCYLKEASYKNPSYCIISFIIIFRIGCIHRERKFDDRLVLGWEIWCANEYSVYF